MADPRGPSDRDRAFARRARILALTIAATMILWIGVQALGGRMGWNPAYALLFDLAAAAAFVWALVAAWRLWQARDAGDI
ncbi:MAG: DUF5337 family protein [Paracoccaceae bacterium]